MACLQAFPGLLLKRKKRCIDPQMGPLQSFMQRFSLIFHSSLNLLASPRSLLNVTTPGYPGQNHAAYITHIAAQCTFISTTTASMFVCLFSGLTADFKVSPAGFIRPVFHFVHMFVCMSPTRAAAMSPTRAAAISPTQAAAFVRQSRPPVPVPVTACHRAPDTGRRDAQLARSAVLMLSTCMC